MDTQLPLDGIKVIDLTQVMLGPCATQMLADFGADVIKIEKPGSGDLSRWSVETDPAKGDNPVFCSLNRNKRSIAVDLRSAEGQAIVHDLVRGADVIVNNFRAGVMERLNLGYETLAALNPRLVYGFGSGFGASGPYAHKGGQDVLAQAMSGVMARKADPGHPLTVYATALCDYSAGMHLVQGILAALLGREKTGRGQMVEVSLYDSRLSLPPRGEGRGGGQDKSPSPMTWVITQACIDVKDGGCVDVCRSTASTKAPACSTFSPTSA